MKKDHRTEADIAERAKAWYRLSDDTVRLRLTQEGSPVPSCSKGCWQCCTLLVLATLPEAVAIVERLFEPGQEALLRDVKRQLPEVLDQLKETALAVGDWFQRRQPCIYLSSKKVCRVYEARPSVCRLYYVATDPSWCGDRETRAVGVLDTDEIRTASFRAMHKILEAEELELMMAPLQVATAWALKLHAAGTREWRTWVAALPDDHVLSPVFWKKAMESMVFKETHAAADSFDKVARRCAARGIDPGGMTIEQMMEALDAQGP